MQEEPYFIFKGINSRQMRIMISSLPDITKPKRKTTTILIPGRNGSFTESTAAYENYTLSIGCGIEHVKQSEINQLWEWLDGSGDLILCTQPKMVYKARIDDSISLSDKHLVFQNFLLQFDVQPFKYNVNAQNDFIIAVNPIVLHNKGNYFSEPVITLFGSGDLYININGKRYGCNAVDGPITIDSQMQMVYYNHVNYNSEYTAEIFPVFQKGDNQISFSGDVKRVEIQPNWRWL